jgi:uncharacterized protein YebE (UPF0316 family)
MQVLAIFLLRVIDVGLATVRLMMVSRGYKAAVWGLGFLSALIFVTTIRPLIGHLDDWAKLLGYAGGFATGIVVGLLIEERMAVGYTHLRIISPRRGSALAERLRGKGRRGGAALLQRTTERSPDGHRADLPGG